MGYAPVGKLMVTMGIPMILSMVLQAFYNIVDSWFVSQMPDSGGITGLGEYGVNALTLAFPVQILMIGIGVGTGVGINALLSRSLGKGDREMAGVLAGNGIFLGLCTYAVFLVIGIFGVEAVMRSQTSDPIAQAMGSTYLRICMVLSFGSILFMIYEKLLQATGCTGLSMVCQVSGALVNIVLDPVMIFGLWGFPAMGIAGAAWATVAGQIFSLVLSMLFHYGKNHDVPHGMRYLKPQTAVIGQIYAIGVPAIIMQVLMSVMTYGINIIFGRLGASVVTAYGVYYKIQQFVVFAAAGLNNALIPILSFNYGMGSVKRVRQSIRFGMAFTLVMMAAGMIGFQIFAEPLVSLFALSGETLRLCVLAMHIVTLGYLCIGANTAFQGIFQAFGNGVMSLAVSLIRLCVVVLPLALWLTTFDGAENLVWWAFPIAEVCGLLAALIFMRKIEREKIAGMTVE